MKGLLRKLENIYAAAAFAEEREFETAREIMRDRKATEKRDGKRADKEYRTRLVLTAHK